MHSGDPSRRSALAVAVMAILQNIGIARVAASSDASAQSQPRSGAGTQDASDALLEANQILLRKVGSLEETVNDLKGQLQGKSGVRSPQ